jgi:hypothetical protein
MIKDTSITDRGAFQLVFWCLGLEVYSFYFRKETKAEQKKAGREKERKQEAEMTV